MFTGGGAASGKPLAWSLISLQLPFSPMRLFAVRIEHPNAVAVQRSHHADARQHRRPAPFGDQDQRFHRRQPFRALWSAFGSFVM
jgi:hypothetical protein